MAPNEGDDVFLNHPLDDEYVPFRNALVFAVHDCGFRARSAVEAMDASENRLDKIYRIIDECRYGIHDISRTELNEERLPRFNMPFELGIFLGCKRFGGVRHQNKSCLVLDREKYRYQKFLSDLSGVDIESHDGDPLVAIRRVRDWLRTTSDRPTIAGAQGIRSRYDRFTASLPAMLATAGMDQADMNFFDYATFVVEWLRVNR